MGSSCEKIFLWEDDVSWVDENHWIYAYIIIIIIVKIQPYYSNINIISLLKIIFINCYHHHNHAPTLRRFCNCKAKKVLKYWRAPINGWVPGQLPPLGTPDHSNAINVINVILILLTIKCLLLLILFRNVLLFASGPGYWQAIIKRMQT